MPHVHRTAAVRPAAETQPRIRRVSQIGATGGPSIEVSPIPTYALRGPCSLAADALAAQMAPIMALTALAALELSGDPFHEPFHGNLNPLAAVAETGVGWRDLTTCTQS